MLKSLKVIYVAIVIFALLMESVVLIMIWDIWQPIVLMVIAKSVILTIIVNSCIAIYTDWVSIISVKHGEQNETRTGNRNLRVPRRVTHGSQQ